MAGIVAKPTKADLVAVCTMVMQAIKAGKASITINGVTFKGFTATGWCSRNVRWAVGATIYGAEWGWPYASCCARRTAERLRAAGLRVSRDPKPGDIVAFGGGGKCGTCGGAVGHIGVYMGNNMLWQNTSYNGLGTCIIPIRQSQWEHLLGVYEILPDAPERPILVVEHGTGEVLGYVVDGGLHVDDQRKVYVELT